MRLSEVEFSDKFFDSLIKRGHLTDGKNQFTDRREPGLLCWVSKSGRITFSCRVRINGKRHRIALGMYRELDECNKPLRYQEVKHRMRLAIYELEHGDNAPQRPKVPFLSELFQRYAAGCIAGNKKARRRQGLPKKWESTLAAFNRVYEPLLNQRTHLLTYNQLIDAETKYLNQREKATGKRPEAMIASIQRSLRPVLRYGVREHWVQIDVVETLNPSPSRKRKRFLLPGEWQYLCPHLDAMPHAGGDFIRFKLYTVARLTQALNLRWKDISTVELVDKNGEPYDLMVWTVPLGFNKSTTGEERIEFKPIVAAAREIIERLQSAPHEPDDYVFSMEVRKMWRRSKTAKALEKASGIRNWVRHDLRHTATTYLGYVGADYKTKGLALTHKHATATAIYDHSTDLLAAAQALVRMHALLKDMETGFPSPTLRAAQSELQLNRDARYALEYYNIPARFLQIQPKLEQTLGQLKPLKRVKI